jgi:thermitase
MKKIITTTLLTISTAAFSQNPNFDGYIVKIKDNANNLVSTKFQNATNVEDLKLSFGKFFKLSSNNLVPLDIEAIKKNPAVEYVEPNYLYYPQDHVAPKPSYIVDKEFDGQWAVYNNGHNTWVANSPIGVDVNVVKAWELTKGSKDIVIAVIDSGINYNHPDLKDNVWVNEKELNGKPGVDDDGNGYIDDIHGYDFANNDGDPLDDNGHGTHVSGIIAATHNEIGVRGVVPNAKIMALKFLTAKGPGDTANALKGIDFAINNGAKVINNSWGGGDYSQAMYDAFKKAAQKNIVIVVAAGNTNNDNDAKPMYPANYNVPGLISVGSFSMVDVKSSFSSYGKKSVHVFAPGNYIISTDVDQPYKWRSGTSMAAPFVSGAVGLLLSKESSLEVEDIKRRVIETSVKNSNYSQYGIGGRLNIYDLLTK